MSCNLAEGLKSKGLKLSNCTKYLNIKSKNRKSENMKSSDNLKTFLKTGSVLNETVLN